MTTTEDKPVDREAWQRLLAGDGDGPPELTDARLRAKARQAIAPRTGRWWLPASLAASLLIAVVLVQRQYERPQATAVVSESDYLTAPAAETPAPSRQDSLQREAAPASEERELANVSAKALAEERVAANKAESDDSRLEAFVAPPPPVVPPPLVDLPVMNDARATSAAPAEAPAAATPAAEAAVAEAKRDEKEKDAAEVVVTSSRIRNANMEAATPVTQVTAADVTNQGAAHAGGLLKSGVAERTPEQWYAEIERLRAAGKKREAKRELEKLRKIHPGWLEEHHPTER